MNNANPGKSPKLAAEDLQDVQQLLEGLSALAKSLGRSMPANERTYNAADLEARAKRVGQIAAYFLDQGKPASQPASQPAAKSGPSKKALQKKGKGRLAALTGADKDFVDGLDSNARGNAGLVLRSRLWKEVWPLVVAGDVDLLLASKVCQVEEQELTGETWAVLVERMVAREEQKAQQKAAAATP